LAGDSRNFKADWLAVWDLKQRCYVDLSDPFESSAEWRPAKTGTERLSRRLIQPLEALLTPRRRRGRPTGEPPAEPDDETDVSRDLGL
jgi:hypothetical protein